MLGCGGGVAWCVWEEEVFVDMHYHRECKALFDDCWLCVLWVSACCGGFCRYATQTKIEEE